MKIPVRLIELSEFDYPFKSIKEALYTYTINVTLIKFTDPKLVIYFSFMKDDS